MLPRQVAESYIYTCSSPTSPVQFYCHLCVGCPRRVETASAWTPPLRMDTAPMHCWRRLPSHLDKWCRIISLGVLVAPEGLDFQHPSSSSRGYSLLLLHVQYNLPHFSHHTLHQVEPGLSAQPKRLHYSNILIEHLIRNTSPPRRHLKQC